MMHSLPAVLNRNMNNLDWTKRSIILRISRHPGDLLYQLHCSLVALSEDRIAAVQMWHRHFSNKELRPIRVRSGIRIRQSPRAIEGQIGRNFIFEFISRIAGPIANWISSLNHEVRNHAMENCAVIKRDPMLSHALHGLPILGSSSKANKIRDSNR